MKNLRIFQILFFTGGAVTANGICWRWLPAGASRQLEKHKFSPPGKALLPICHMKPCEINNRTSPNFMPPANGNNLLFSV